MHDLSIMGSVSGEETADVRNQLCTGALKAAQAFIRVFLTKPGSQAHDPQCGTSFMAILGPGVVMREDVVELRFQLAASEAMSYFNRLIDADDSEIPARATLDSWDSDGNGLRLNISITTRSGEPASAGMLIGYPIA